LAALVVALVRTLSGVDAKVVEEIVPFVEDFSAVLACTVQELLRLLVSDRKEFVDIEVSCAGHVLLDADLVQVERGALLNQHKGGVLDLFFRNNARLSQVYFVSFFNLLLCEDYALFLHARFIYQVLQTALRNCVFSTESQGLLLVQDDVEVPLHLRCH
jgi:hypothetical protein